MRAMVAGVMVWCMAAVPAYAADPLAEVAASLRALAGEVSTRAEQLTAALKKLDDAAEQQVALQTHLARRVEYLPGQKDPASLIPIYGPFTVGHTFLVVRAGSSAVERYAVTEIYGNGWLRVSAASKECPLRDRALLWLNADQVVMASLDD